MTKNRNILDEVCDVLRLHHYSIHTERTYCDWIRRFIRFHKMQSRDDLKDGENKIESFLTHLAVHANVAPATQNQAMNALIFLYRKVLKQELAGAINAIRAKKKEFKVIQGEVPEMKSLPDICSFMPRCKYAKLKCGKKRPEIEYLHGEEGVRCYYPMK